ncbi:NACHT, LRR and PYD domains-containing protein 3-like [Pocillopora verrucosa]|uniref:NACHT, LRR and PYD domains-containing protein 3-like n=1 Tax=Pocillopora verrucosa TaxID=203993 RepID=UPI0033422B49
MECAKEYLLSKYFSRVGYIVAVFHLLALVSHLAVTATLRRNERLRFSCQSVTHLRDYCLVRYDEQYAPLPLYGFVLLCFVPLVVVCITYSCCCVKSRVDELETALKADPENPRRRPRRASHRVFYCYFTHLLLRCSWGILCAALQKCVFYPAEFPAEFSCVAPTLKPIVNSTNSNTTKDYSSVMIINCDNSFASDETWNATEILVVNAMLALLVFGEMCYLLVQRSRSKEFTLDSEFCQKHFWNKKTLSLTLSWAISRMREHILKETETIEPLIAESDGKLKVDDNFVDLVIYTGRAEHEFPDLSDRHKIFGVYMKPQHGSVAFNTVKELFLPNEDTQNPCKILVVGRPGIGKSLLCMKILRDWGKDVLLHDFHLLYLILFKWFNDETPLKITLKELLCRLHPDGGDNELFQYILDNPEKVIIVFDGLDEFKYHSHCQDDEELYGNDATNKMPLSALYVKLVKGKLLLGATILTTSRPNAVQSIAHLTELHIDRKVEIMGFTPKKICEYVQKRFAHDKDKAGKIWNHISSNLELKSLCHIPLNMCIICFLLEEWLKLQEQDQTRMALPSASTEVYRGALKLFIFKHHLEFRGKPLTEDFLQKNVDFPATVEVTLNKAGALAKKGIEQGQLVFDSHEVQGIENCGLFNHMPNREVSSSKFKSQYCFLHLKFQEFLAAREIAKMNPGDLESFVRRNALDPKWHLVLQFVAGVLGFKKNSAGKIFVNMLCESIKDPKQTLKSWQMVFLMMKCLHEYNDEATAKQAAFEIQSSETFDNKIDLWQCNITGPDCAAIVYLIKHLYGNIVLLLGSNCITDKGVPYLCAALKGEHCKLTKLNLRGNRISDKGVSYLCAALKDEHCHLTKLDLGYNNVSDEGLPDLCAALNDEHCKLEKLDLKGNRISDQGVSHLCTAPKDKHCKLAKLDLSCNSISDVGVSYLCVALKEKNFELTKLDLAYNKISDKGISELCAALEDGHCKLKKLNLKGNGISDKGVPDLCAALKDEHCKLTKLDLGYNNVSDQGVSHLCAARKDEH